MRGPGLEGSPGCEGREEPWWLYHWSPVTRRTGIAARGLVPGMAQTTNPVDPAANGGVQWRAPYICLAADPAWGWGLSGHQRGAPAGEWDLWQVRIPTGARFETLDAGCCCEGHGGRVREVRVYDRIYKRNVLWVAARTKPPAGRRAPHFGAAPR